MSSDRRRLNTQIDQTLADVLDRWCAEWRKTESEVVRTALTLGLQSLARDPSPLGPRPVAPEDMSPPDLDKQVKEERARTKRKGAG